MEEKLDELIALTKLQNNAWEHCLNMLNGIATIMNEKHLAQEKLLQEHPTIRESATIQEAVPPTESPTVGNQRQPQPFNNYTDTMRYGAGLEEERVPTGQSFPPPNPNEFQSSAQQLQQSPARPQNVPAPLPPQPQPTPEPIGDAGETVVALDQTPVPEPSVQGPPVTSKAELLERQGSTS